MAGAGTSETIGTPQTSEADLGPVEIAVYLGGALLYALFGTALWAVACSAVGRRQSMAATAFVLSALFVVFLGLHPFPDPATLDCTQGGPRPILRPFAFFDAFRIFWQQGRPLGHWLTSLAIISPIMNLVFYVLVGGLLAGVTRNWTSAALTACGLTLFVEISQLTGLYGIYPCRYRTFEVDDLILNAAGVLLGFVLRRWWYGAARNSV